MDDGRWMNDRQIDGWTDGWMDDDRGMIDRDGWMDVRWMIGRDGWMDGWMQAWVFSLIICTLSAHACLWKHKRWGGEWPWISISASSRGAAAIRL